jgi:hypothetical protein
MMEMNCLTFFVYEFGVFMIEKHGVWASIGTVNPWIQEHSYLIDESFGIPMYQSVHQPTTGFAF